MPKIEELYDYKNFWLIWLNCAGSLQGTTLFKIQTNWGIKTNYLYHNETGLKNPLYESMLNKSYLGKVRHKLVGKFDWIPLYMKAKHEPNLSQNTWTPGRLVLTKWPQIQDFIEKNHHHLFSLNNLKTLYMGDRNRLGESGHHIFDDIFLMVLYSNLIGFFRKYHADIVLRIISTMISMFSDRDILGYIHNLNLEIGHDVPLIIRNEAELNSLMHPVRL